MKKLIGVLVILIGLSACNSSSALKCQSKNPLEDLPWLKELKESLNKSDVEKSIFQASYKKETVFYVMVTDPRVRLAFGVTLLDCEGRVVREFKSGESDDFEKLVVDRIVLYKYIPKQDE